MTGVDSARRILIDAIAAHVFPAASVEVGTHNSVSWREALGTLTFVDDAVRTHEHTLFDLASLTKAMATTAVVMHQVELGAVRLDDLVAACFPEWLGADRHDVTIKDLLEHSSGLAPRLVDAPPRTRREFEHDICIMPLEYPPRTQSVYTDLGFILLGFLASDRGSASLDELFARLIDQLSQREPPVHRGVVLFNPQVPDHAPTALAPTVPLEDDRRRGRTLVGEVHDCYAAALGGVAGHAGLFGTAGGVGAFARSILRGIRGEAVAPFSTEVIRTMTSRSSVPGSSRALGWDTMLPTSSCGTQMSPTAFGHVGFTGTSLWIDPARDRYFVLLTNRACGGGTLDQMRSVRRAFHDALGSL